jgi:SAM-dependent methyltransferase
MMFIKKIKGTLRSNRLNNKILSEVERACVLNRGMDVPIRLPEPFGRNLPERVIEILCARLSYRPGLRVLDVGCSNAMESHLRMIGLLAKPRHIIGIDISPPTPKVLCVYDDFINKSIISSDIAAESLDLIWCISALEHFGMDNSTYTDRFELSQEMDAQAVQEMVRLLAVNGRLLITVPYGKYEDHTWFRNYDAEHLWNLLHPVEGVTLKDVTFFRHTHGSGWRSVAQEELQHVGYYDQANGGSAGLAVIMLTKTPTAGDAS